MSPHFVKNLESQNASYTFFSHINIHFVILWLWNAPCVRLPNSHESLLLPLSCLLAKHFPENKLTNSSERGKKKNQIVFYRNSGVKSIEWMKWAMNGAGEKEKTGWMEEVLLFKVVRLHRRGERWVIRDLEDCYCGRQFIPALRCWRKEKRRLVNGGVKTGKWLC